MASASEPAPAGSGGSSGAGRSPSVGSDSPSRVALSFYYDPGGLLVRCDLEHRDATGALDSSNPAYSAFAVHDVRGRLVVVVEPIEHEVTAYRTARDGLATAQR